MKKMFNSKIIFILILLISILIVIKIDILQISHYSILKTKHLFPNELKQSIKIAISNAVEENRYYAKSIVIRLITNTAKKKIQ